MKFNMCIQGDKKICQGDTDDDNEYDPASSKWPFDHPMEVTIHPWKGHE